MNIKKQFNQKGFTLFELLTVLFAISILFTIVFMLVSPAKQMIRARNAQRLVDARTLDSAINQYIIDNSGVFPGPGKVTREFQEICSTTGSSCAGLLDLGDLIFKQRYVAELPRDPLCTNSISTCYTLKLAGSRRIEVEAPLHETYIEPTVEIIKWNIRTPILFFAFSILGFLVFSFIVIIKKR